MYVACSTLCYGKQPLPHALRKIGELHFQKVDVALHECGPHLKPSEVAADPARAAAQIRKGTPVVPTAFHVQIDAADPAEYARQLAGVCRLARALTVSLVCIPAAAIDTDVAAEVKRLTALNRIAIGDGVVLTIETHHATLTADPKLAVELCERVPGLGLTFDPSHYLTARLRDGSYDAIFPHVKHVRLRDSGVKPEEFQVRVGQGKIEYGRIIAQLERHRYDRVLTVDIHDEFVNAETPMDVEVRKLKYLLESMI